MYAFKRVSKIADQKGVVTYDSNEPPVPFLDSLLLGEVKKISKISPFFFLFLKITRFISARIFSHGFRLQCQWEDRMQRGLFRYDVTACETKVYLSSFSSLFSLSLSY